jgi:hypothetical protein
MTRAPYSIAVAPLGSERSAPNFFFIAVPPSYVETRIAS